MDDEFDRPAPMNPGRDRAAQSEQSRSAASPGQVIKPDIIIAPGQLDRLPEQIAQALASHGSYFRRDLILMKAVRPMERAFGDPGVVRQVGAMTFVRVDADLVRRDIARCANLLKFDGRSGLYVPTDLSTGHARAFLAASRELTAFPIVRGITNAPILRCDGSIVARDGYDPKSRFVLDTGGVDFSELRIPKSPTMEDARAALAVLKEPLQDFDFEDACDQSVILSALLSAIVRPLLRTCPLHGVSSPSFGAGKTLLTDLVSAVATGNRITTAAPGHSQEELEKRIDSLIVAGDPLVCLDNLSLPLGANNLCSILTGGATKIRLLGFSDSVTISSTTLWFATGTNLAMRGDMVRRAVVARLDPNLENPEFRHDFAIPDLVAWALENRIPMLSAAFTVLLAHAQAGQPCSVPALGSFPDWSRLVRGALTWAGEADPVHTQKHIGADDPIWTTRALVFESIWRVKRDQIWTVANLAEVATRVHGRANTTPDEIALAEALAMSSPMGKFDPSDFSYFLRGCRDVIAAGLKLERVMGDTHDHRARYRIVNLAEKEDTDGAKGSA